MDIGFRIIALGWMYSLSRIMTEIFLADEPLPDDEYIRLPWAQLAWAQENGVNMEQFTPVQVAALQGAKIAKEA